MARGPSKLTWYDRVPKNKSQLQSFTELQYLEALRKAAARNYPQEKLTLKEISEALGIPLKKLKQFMVSSDGFTKEMAVKYAETIHVPPKVLNRVGRSLFKGPPEPEKGDEESGPSEMDLIREKAAEAERKRKNPYEKGPIDLSKVKRITFVSYLDFTHLAVCHLEDDGTLKISFVPDHVEEVNKNPWTQEILLGETVPVIQAVPHGRKQVNLTETHVPVRKTS